MSLTIAELSGLAGLGATATDVAAAKLRYDQLQAKATAEFDQVKWYHDQAVASRATPAERDKWLAKEDAAQEEANRLGREAERAYDAWLAIRNQVVDDQTAVPVPAYLAPGRFTQESYAAKPKAPAAKAPASQWRGGDSRATKSTIVVPPSSERSEGDAMDAADASQGYPAKASSKAFTALMERTFAPSGRSRSVDVTPRRSGADQALELAREWGPTVGVVAGGVVATWAAVKLARWIGGL